MSLLDRNLTIDNEQGTGATTIKSNTGISHLNTSVDLATAVAFFFNSPTGTGGAGFNTIPNEIHATGNSTTLTPSLGATFREYDSTKFLSHGHVGVNFQSDIKIFKSIFELDYAPFPANASSVPQEDTLLFIRLTDGTITGFLSIRDDRKIYIKDENGVNTALSTENGDVLLPTGSRDVVKVAIEVVAKADGTYRVVPAVQIGAAEVLECNDIDSTRLLANIDGRFRSYATEWSNIGIGRILDLPLPTSTTDPYEGYFSHTDLESILVGDNAEAFAWGLLNDAEPQRELTVDVGMLFNNSHLVIKSPNKAFVKALRLSNDGELELLNRSNNKAEKIGTSEDPIARPFAEMTIIGATQSDDSFPEPTITSNGLATLGSWNNTTRTLTILRDCFVTGYWDSQGGNTGITYTPASGTSEDVAHQATRASSTFPLTRVKKGATLALTNFAGLQFNLGYRFNLYEGFGNTNAGNLGINSWSAPLTESTTDNYTLPSSNTLEEYSLISVKWRTNSAVNDTLGNTATTNNKDPCR